VRFRRPGLELMSQRVVPAEIAKIHRDSLRCDRCDRCDKATRSVR
jgi:hypothetical protein